MATLYTNQSSNIRKTWLLVAVFLAVIAAIGYFLSYYYGSPRLLYIALGLSIVMNVGSYWFSDKIVLSLSGAREADETQYRELHRILENLAITAGLPKPRLYVIDDPAPNAFATGRNKEHAAVAVTAGLLSALDRSELEGVLAHELSHVGNRDILLSSMVAVLVGLVAISRKREFLADSSGALLTRYPEGLASALRKISGYPSSMQKASNATAHMYISNPFGARGAKGLSRLFLTHPPVEERIRALLGRDGELR